MFLTRISVNHPVFATMVMVALLVFGLYSYARLPIEQMPDVDFPVVAVVVSYPGASPEAVENDIVRPIEDQVNTIAGLDSIQSTAMSGSAMVLMIFELEVSSETAAQDVRDKVSQIEAALPDAAGKPTILRFDPSALPIVSLAVTSDTLSARDLTTLTEDVIVTRLSNISGVGSATAVGGIERRLNVLVDPDRLAAFNVGISDVITALRQENQNLPAGTITQGATVQTIQIEGRIENEEGFLDIIVSRRGGQPVYLRDVATIEDGQGDEQSLALLNGQRALAVDVIKTQGANTVQVAHDIHTAIDRLMDGGLPEGVRIDVVRDNAVPVEQSFHAVQNMLIEGAILAVVIVFLFLNSWRSTVITGLTLPISIIGTMIFLNFFGFTLNMMTLMALSLAVGILIDDAIVVRENIMRHLHMGKNHRQAALDGTNEIGLAVLATTLSIVAVFLPVAFMDGIMGRFFLQFGVTVSVAVLISLFVAFTLDPMMSSVWYDPAANPDAKRGPLGRAIAQFDRFFGWLSNGYRGLLAWCLKWRKTTLMVALASFVGTFFLFPFVGAEFIPATDNSEVQVTMETPTGSSLDYTATKIAQVDDVLRALPEVVSTYATVASGTGRSGNNTATIVIGMVPESQRDVTPTEFSVTVREALTVIPGATFTVAASGGFGGPTAPISIGISGASFDTLDRLSDQLIAGLRDIPGLIDVKSSLEDATPIMAVRVNRDLASDLGVSLAQIGAALNPMLAGDEVTDWTNPRGENLGVFVRLPEWARNDVSELGNLPIVQSGATGSNAVIRLDQVASIEEATGPATINREALARRVNVTANIEGVALGQVVPQIQAVIDAMSVPTGYSVSQGGEAEDLAETGAAAGSALLLAVIFIYLVLASQFGSFLQPFAIMVSLPLSLIGVVLGLLVGGSTLNMMSMIGFIMLMGLVVKNAILLVDNANQHVREGLPLRAALIEAGHTRFRPIIMTTLAMIFGMLPLALSLHEGSAQNAPMAHAVIGGLISSTLLTLVVVPVMLTYLDGLGRFVSRFTPRAPDDVVHAPAE
ncbi:hydrophobic/amphiphilic exporter-1, HAE1 family [Devosia enhydra]|uniref:Hydrophobic/amphiphilic exporter-1, HAE1 family n=1 Tax=Devosia enhydra TaxID=665118 RepID=A0A1K2I027_9HYPH|nr:efflux RND transporter permease subunit [Devosia enhydra]SFZ85631.1 hydrophobic/amphiphilic exporter-1, HAE1 family [Devosia enhydra]